MDYLKFYDLEHEPFQNDPDGRFYYESPVHRRARMLLLRGAHQRKGLSVMVGGPGCGKTTLAHLIYEGLDEGTFSRRLITISHSECAHGWMLPHVARSFGIKKPAADGPSQLEQIRLALGAHIARDRFPVLLVDEAQLLSNSEVMEEFRGLLNLAHDGKKMISLLLFGLPELSEILRLDAPLNQRVEIRADVAGLPAEEVKSYVQHRLERAGATGNVFSDDALDALHRYSEGVPRLINTLADNALFEGLMSEARLVDASLVAAAAEQLELSPDLDPASAEVPTWAGHPVEEAAHAPLPPAVDELPAEDASGEFSMGSLVRDADDPAETDGAGALDLELEELGEEPELELEELDLEVAAEEEADADLADMLEEEDPDHDLGVVAQTLDVELADDEEEPGSETHIEAPVPEADEGPDTGFNLGDALLDEGAEPFDGEELELEELAADDIEQTPSTPVPESGDDFIEELEDDELLVEEPLEVAAEVSAEDDEFDEMTAAADTETGFDPGELLEELESKDADDDDELPSKAQTSEGGEELDDLFENIQVGD